MVCSSQGVSHYNMLIIPEYKSERLLAPCTGHVRRAVSEKMTRNRVDTSGFESQLLVTERPGPQFLYPQGRELAL